MTKFPKSDTMYPALILKANRGVIHHGVVGIARTLGRLGVPVYAVVEDGYTPLATSRYIAKTFVWKSWPSDTETFLSSISKIAETIRRPTILLAVDDLSSAIVAENANALSQWFLLPQLPAHLPRELANKASFYSLCTKVGIPCARTVIPRNADDIDAFVKDAAFPIVLKAAEQWQLIKGKYSTTIIYDREQLIEFCSDIREDDYSSILLQEYIPGEDWIYHGYCNFRKDLYVGFTGKKLASFPPGAGATVLGISSANAMLTHQCEKLLKAISYSGIIDMDWRHDERDGQYKIMDCNPRVGQNFRMFENTAGVDVVKAQYLDLAGCIIDRAPMIEGRVFTVEPFYFISLLRRGRRRNASTSGLVGHSPAGNRELAWWRGDDPLPALMMCIRLLQRVVKRTSRRIWVRG
jgi:D-aspartate ligase